jgi:hypothetical protein
VAEWPEGALAAIGKRPTEKLWAFFFARLRGGIMLASRELIVSPGQVH